MGESCSTEEANLNFDFITLRAMFGSYEAPM
jgi:hypothetical protein